MEEGTRTPDPWYHKPVFPAFLSQYQGAWRVTWRIHPKIITNAPEEALLNKAWPDLPEHIRDQIADLVKSNTEGHSNET